MEATQPPSQAVRPSAHALTDGDALLQFLATRDVGCPACGYNLRGSCSRRDVRSAGRN